MYQMANLIAAAVISTAVVISMILLLIDQIRKEK